MVVRGLALHLRLTLPLLDGASVGPLQLDALELRDVGHIWLDLQGLGAFQYLLEAFANLASNAFKWSLTEAVLEPVANAIRREIVALPPFELLQTP